MHGSDCRTKFNTDDGMHELWDASGRDGAILYDTS